MSTWDDITAAAEPITEAKDAQLAEALSTVTGLSTQVQDLKTALTSASAQISALVTQLNDSRLQLGAALARIKELEGGQGVKTKYGACPAKGGTSLAAQTTVVTKYGNGAAVRQYFGAMTQVAPRDPNVGLLHASWKDYTTANITEAKVKAAVANLKAGDVVELGHESDNDNLTGTALTARWNIKNLFYDVVKKVRPDLLVSLTMVGYSFDPKSGKDLTPWVENVRFDVLGVDCDGVKPTKLPYTDYQDETKTALAFLAKYPKIKYVAIPEFGCPRLPALDPDGAIRASYHDFYAELWRATGKVLFVALFEYSAAVKYELTTPAEINGWKAQVAK